MCLELKRHTGVLPGVSMSAGNHGNESLTQNKVTRVQTPQGSGLGPTDKQLRPVGKSGG